MTLKRKTPLKRTSFKKDPKEPRAFAIGKMLNSGLVKQASSLSRSRKNTGEKEVFKLIWDSRKHACEVCGIGIREAKASNFHHLLNKGHYPRYRLDERNITLLCLKCHDHWHKTGFAGLFKNPSFPLWQNVCGVYIALRNEANGILVQEHSGPSGKRRQESDS